MNIKNAKGPNIYLLPWGTPCVTGSTSIGCTPVCQGSLGPIKQVAAKPVNCFRMEQFTN